MPSREMIMNHTIDAGTLIDQLSALPRDIRISFGGLDYSRVKLRGPDIAQIEFVQQVYRTDKDILVVEDIT